MPRNTNPSAHPRSAPFKDSTHVPPANDSCHTRKVSDGSSPICSLCRNGYNTQPEHYPSYIVFANPIERVICTPCAQSIATALED